MTLSSNDIEFNNKQLSTFRNNNNNISSTVVSHYINKYKNLRSLTNKLSLTRRYFIENGYTKKYANELFPGKEITRKVKNENDKILENTKIIKIKKSFVDNIINTYNTENNDYLKLAVYLLLSSGRRMNEILNSKFTIDENNEKNVLIDVILKKRDGSKYYSIKIIGNRDTFIKTLKRFNYLTSELRQITIRQNIQDYIRKNYASIGLLTSHYFRVLYANYLFKYENPEDILYNVFLKNVLNHASLLSSINYSTIKITK